MKIKLSKVQWEYIGKKAGWAGVDQVMGINAKARMLMEELNALIMKADTLENKRDALDFLDEVIDAAFKKKADIKRF